MKKSKQVLDGVLDVFLVLFAMVALTVGVIITLPVIFIGWIIIVPLSSLLSMLDKNESSLCKTINYSTRAFLSGMAKSLENIVSKMGS